MLKTFGQTLQEFRRNKKISQRELAREVDVDFSYISKIENDRLPPPAADTIMKICEILEIPADNLLALTGKVPTNIKQSIGSSPGAQQFVREASKMNLSEEEWKSLTNRLKRLRK
ncbi:MAG: helix-turn-helix domain-containing protein [Candidatus Scalinduaceae bacterium]